MRADEYLVEEIIKLKKENEELKANNNRLLIEIEDLKKDNTKENDIILNKEFKKIYNVVVYETNWKIKDHLKEGTFKLEDLEELLENDQKLDEFYYFFDGWDKPKAYKIKEIFASYEIHNRNDKAWIYVYGDEKDNSINCGVYYRDNNFETYEEALKYGREESRKVIKKVLDDYNRRKN